MYVFSVVSLIILFTACINFMNLSTAKSSLRAKEVGMRKIVGSGKSQLVAQFIACLGLFGLASFIVDQKQKCLRE